MNTGKDTEILMLANTRLLTNDAFRVTEKQVTVTTVIDGKVTYE